MLELPGWNDLISVNGFCYSSSMGESPKLNIPLKTSVAPTKGIASPTFARNSTATYIDANGVLQTAAIDVPRFQNGRYLVEPAAINLFLQSGTPATQTITVVLGSVYTVQCFGTGNITLSGAGSGTVVQSTPVTFTAVSTTLTCVPTSVNKAQVELGSKATSYIPTTSAPFGRVPDVLNYDVSSVITQGQGSLYCEFKYSYNTGFPRIFELYSDAANEIIVRVHSSKILGAYVIYGGVNSTILSTSYQLQDSTLYKVGLSYKANDLRFYVNGELIGQASSVTIPNLSILAIGMTRLAASQLNGEIGNIKYFKEVLTPAEAIKLTTV